MPRYALYLVPPASHPLWATGNAWLGRDPAAPPATWGPPPPLRREPWRYGFHATLKAPLRLAPGHTEASLLDATRSLADAHAPFDMPPLAVSWLAGFLSLRPQPDPAPHEPLRELADDAVRRLDPGRAPWTEAERARYVRPDHSPRQRAQAERWGYAHVLDDWRCHFTLSDPVAGGDAQALHAAAQAHFAPALAVPLRCTELALYLEPAPGDPFALWQRLPLHGPAVSGT
ncbi:DUF1045 domain-containing protein [Roseateles paludis]|uniref:DUF1045 domain-containing protein n=1 Tax=Roseateles paludis TaxID=3145238 RepID=A0ABV0FY08_9BURK